MLSDANQRFLDYKGLMDKSQSFANGFPVPPPGPEPQVLAEHFKGVEQVQWVSSDHVISGGSDGVVRIWDCWGQAQQPLSSFRCDGALHSMALSEDRARVLTGLDCKAVNLQTWHLGRSQLLLKQRGHTTPVSSCTYAPDGHSSTSGSIGGVVCFHDSQLEEPLTRVEGHAKTVFSLDFNRCGTMVCSASGDGTVKVFDVRSRATAACAASCTIADAAGGEPVFKALWRGDTELLTCGGDYCVKRWDMRYLGDGPIRRFVGHSSPVKSMALSTDERVLASGTSSGDVRVWHVDEGTTLRESWIRADVQMSQLEGLIEKQSENTISWDYDDLSICVLDSQLQGAQQTRARLADQLREQRGSTMDVQAIVMLDAGIAPITSMAWCHSQNGLARLAYGAQDQKLRVVNFDSDQLASKDVDCKDEHPASYEKAPSNDFWRLFSQWLL